MELHQQSILVRGETVNQRYYSRWLKKIIKKIIGIIDDTYGFEKSCRYYEDYAPTIRSERTGLKVIKIVCERRMDEGLRTFKDGVIGTIRTIDAGGVNE